MPDDLTPVQRSVLLVLMAAVEEVPNVDLTGFWRLKLEKRHRDDLEKRGFITVKTENRRIFLSIAHAGTEWCGGQAGAQVPPRMGHAGAAAYALLGVIRRHLERTGGSLTEFVVGTGKVPATTVTEESVPRAVVADPDLAELIRKAYFALAAAPGQRIRLSDIRPRLGASDRATVDRALVALNQAPDVRIEPESDQLSLTDRDREAAVRIGNEPKHVIAIGRP